MKQYSYFENEHGEHTVVFDANGEKETFISSEETEGRAESMVKVLNELLEWQQYDFGIEILNVLKNKTGKAFSEQDIQESISEPAEAFADAIVKEVEIPSDSFMKESEEKKCIVFLRNENILLVVLNPYNDDKDMDHLQYYYDEHVCPTTYVSNILMVIDIEQQNGDPHGIFEFVDAVPYFDVNKGDIESIKKLVPEIFNK